MQDKNKMNIYELPDLPLTEEVTTVLAVSENVRVERIVSSGQASAWYDQSETELVVLLEGHAVIEYENGKSVTLLKGDTLLIQPHERHRVSYTSSEPPCIWFCVFYRAAVTDRFGEDWNMAAEEQLKKGESTQ